MNSNVVFIGGGIALLVAAIVLWPKTGNIADLSAEPEIDVETEAQIDTPDELTSVSTTEEPVEPAGEDFGDATEDVLGIIKNPFAQPNSQVTNTSYPVVNTKTPDPGPKKAEAKFWPPVVDKTFPGVELFDHNGKPFSIDSLPHRPTLIELIAMPCAGCQAFAGGNEVGGFGGKKVQPDLQSIEKYFRQYARHELDSNEINFVQIIFYNMKLQSPSSEELAAWRKHFQLDNQANAYVVSGGESLANHVSKSMIPGFLLLDSDQVVRFDSTGHTPRHNLYTELLPAAETMLDQPW